MKIVDYKIDIEWVNEFRGRVLSAASVKDVKELHLKMVENVTGYDLKYQTINRILTGKRTFPIQLLLQIHALTKKSFSLLLTGKTEEGLDEEEIKREAVREFLAVNAGLYFGKKPSTSTARKIRKRA